MNSKYPTHSIIVIVGALVISTLGYAASDKSVAVVLPPSQVKVTMVVVSPVPSPILGLEQAPIASSLLDSTRWAEIKDQNYELRGRFIAGFKQLQGRVDEQIGELKAQRATATGRTDTKNSDLAIKQLGYARSFFKYLGEELLKATPENWNQQKARVGQAWVRTQEFYTKGKSG